jgi:hypothetical protein
MLTAGVALNTGWAGSNGLVVLLRIMHDMKLEPLIFA